MRRALFAMLLAFVAFPAQLWAQDTGWGDLKLRFVYQGELPKTTKITVTGQDAKIFGPELEDESLLVNTENRGIANVVVYLLPDRDAELPIHPSYRESEKAKVALRMQGGRFVPHILLMRTSQTMVQENRDRVGHNARIGFVRNAPM